MIMQIGSLIDFWVQIVAHDQLESEKVFIYATSFFIATADIDITDKDNFIVIH